MKEIQFFGEYTFEKSPLLVMRGIEMIDLTPRQLETLSLLLDAKGEVVSRETFLDKVWGDVIVEEHNLTQTIFLLRKTLGKLPNGQEYIETVPKKGYRMSPSALSLSTMREPSLSLSDKTKKKIPSPVGPVAPVMEGRRSRSIIKKMFLIQAAVLVVTMAATLLRGFQARPHLLKVRQLTHDGVYKVSDAPIFLRDKRLFLTERQDSRNILASISLDGSIYRNQVLPFRDGVLSGIGTGAEDILIARPGDKGTVTVASLKGGNDRPLSEFNGESPAWSPDGEHLAFIRGQQLFTADKVGQNPVSLATVQGIPFWPVWSPDGTTIRFSVREPDGGQSIQEVNLTTKRLSPVLQGEPHEHRACCGVWTSNGKYFAYVVENSASTSLWVQREEILGWKKIKRSWELVSGPVDFWRAPVIDQDHIYAIGEQARHKLVLLNSKFAPFLPAVSANSLSISHDGQWVAYSVYPEGSLWKSRLDGTERTRLSAHDEYTRMPQWSSDDHEIFYLRMTDGKPWSLARVDARGGKPGILAIGGSGTSELAYSAAGDQLVMDQMGSGSTRSGKLAILSSKGKLLEELPESEGMTAARWSSDGRYISAVSADREQLRVFDRVSRKWDVVFNSARIGASIWDRKGNTLYFTARQGGAASQSQPGQDQRCTLFRFQVGGQGVTQVMEIPEVYANGDVSRTLEFTADGDLIFEYLDGSAEIYDLNVDLR
ncbi:winged helix-turn-helix domain-containing protein [Terriglobus albidus]|uniref:winged helix-turn-helix domain-containing protein n=1 Tax=Terriglobus albidus TaxID=1592106 RepID=UPI0021DF6321|nr:winged helix-turn-helix domain-containing protein [Terriglobus albidus]